MQATPVELTAKPGSSRLGYAEAMVSPCLSCATSPCCSYLPLQTLQIRTLSELDVAVYLLNFDRIELGLAANGDWSVYYRQPCRYLDRSTYGCSVHNQPEQPNICVHFSPYGCWYARSLVDTVTDDFLRIDRARLGYILDHVVLDEERTIVEAPPWDELLEVFATMPVRPGDDFDPTPPADEDLARWQQVVLGPVRRSPPEPLALDDSGLRDPCGGCAAYCCDTLVFPLAVPHHVDNLDWVRFSLGFPGVQLGIRDDAWSILIRTRCRHLEGTRCGVYGREERPLRCRYYDATTCTYKHNLGTLRPEGFLRLDYEHLPYLAECFQADSEGQLLGVPPVEVIRSHVEGRMAQV